MKPIWLRMLEFVRDEHGPTATEYAVMLALIVVVAAGTIHAVGRSMAAVFTDVNTTVVSATG
jgi:pilus assembly protein Flp/PilA